MYLFNYLKYNSLLEDNDNFVNEVASVNRLKTELLDVDKFIKVNNLKEVYDPVFFNGPTPSEHGLLSNEIFGITKSERAGIYAYIDLGGYFLHPLAYKTLKKLNSKIENIVHGIDTYSITETGEIIQDDNGNTGIDWLKKNFSKIKFTKNDSRSRNLKIDFINMENNKIWINKYIVIPAYYRDVDTKQASIGVGEINKLYSSLIIASKSLKETANYGLTLSDATKGRIQNILVQIFDWFGQGTTINGQKTSGNLPGKTGLIKRGALYKTVDYSVRLVMSAPDLEAENIEDLMVDMDHAAEPLAAVLCNFKPFVIFWLRRFFENEFAGKYEYPILTKKGEVISVPILDYQVMFSDNILNAQIERFIHGYSNRFIPIDIPVDMEELAKLNKSRKEKIKLDNIHMMIDYRLESVKNDSTSKEMIHRPLTWCDLFYIAACEVTEDKMVLITRFPIDSYLNQFPSKIRVKSTVKTEPISIEINGETKLFKWYPVIREKDINKNTSPLFSDTLSICNGIIGVMQMDYDGDTSIVKPVYTVEANEECRKVAKSKIQIIGMDGTCVRDVSKENIISLYSLTVHPDKSIKLLDPVF